MSRRVRTSRGLRALVIAVAGTVLVAAGAGYGLAATSHQVPPSPTPSATVKVDSAAASAAVPSGFVGISMEYRGLEEYLGANPLALDQGFVQLLRNLSPSGGFNLRIGGDSSDWSWWPVPGMAQPGGVKYSLTPTWTAVARAVARVLDGRLILGLNLEADSSRLAALEESELLSHIGSGAIQAFELGNEPELYASFPWYEDPAGKHVPGRAPGYGVQQYISDFSHVAAALPKAPLAGPSSGASTWLADLSAYEQAERGLSLVTVHAYPTKHCDKAIPITAPELFVPASLEGLAGEIAGYVHAAAAHHLPLRVDEMNSISCGGMPGLSNSFAPALWALDMLPRIVLTGAVGVNFHTVPNTTNAILAATRTGSGWRVSAQPEYLGLVAFTQAAPAGSHLLSVTTTIPDLDAWGSRTATGQVHVVLINLSGTSRVTGVSVAGTPAGVKATVTRLQAPSLLATSGVTLAGQVISPLTGALSGPLSAASVAPVGGVYSVSVPAWSAAIVALP